MLDTATKKRIDDCRDILVGKLPDPKAQIEQITIGLIYKFMDDMDKEAVELGGTTKFFSGDFEKYSWDSLFDTRVTATEMLNLYSKAIESMVKNPNIPQLFRDIFNNAYLPYRDPETLKLFLKTIGKFEYTHSEKLGDAFEYLLSVMGSQGDAGQFRTPRHIIDFMVAIVDPGKNDTILDPACGTAGFLISAFKHIKEKNKKGLTPDERKRLIQNFVGYDISPDMVRLSLVNLYLHGFSDPHINEYDTLSSEERWNECYDVILANPPFMSPKGGIRPHKKFTISSNRSEVLFVDYIAEHLNPKGKSGIIVPEGVIFQSGTAYKDLRKMLIENYLYAVVSLPAGVFNPYSGVKTSILLINKEVAKQRNEILFVKIDNDGYNLGSQRTAVKGSQLEEAIKLTHEFARKGEFKTISIAHAVPKSDIAKNGEYNLSGNRYIADTIIETEFEKVLLVDVLDYEQPTEYIVENTEYNNSFKTPVLTAGKSFILGHTNEEYGIFKEPLPVIIFDDFTTATQFVDFPFKVKSSAMKILKAKKGKANITFLYYLMQHIEFDSSDHKRYWISQYSQIQIPLPQLSIQREIVAEIDGYQKIINGAKSVVDNYKPRIDIDPEWKMVELGELISTQTGGTPSKLNEEYWQGQIPWVSPKDMKVDFISDAKDYISEEAVNNSSTKIVPRDTILIVVRSGILKHTLPIALTVNPVSFNQDIIAIQPASDSIIQKYLFYYLKSTAETHIKDGIKPGVTVQSFHNGYFKRLNIPLPTLEMQCQIISQIEKEQELVDANKQLIVMFEQKIKDRIAKVWGE
jgi:type I restriction enzyme M protein